MEARSRSQEQGSLGSVAPRASGRCKDQEDQRERWLPSSFSQRRAGPSVDDIGVWKGGSLPVLPSLPPSTILVGAAGACSFGSAIYLPVPGVSWSPALPPHSAPLP